MSPDNSELDQTTQPTRIPNVNFRDDKGRTYLHCAVMRNDFEMTQFLLDHEADVDAADYCGDTPLHYAVFNGVPQMVLELLKKGAKPNLTNDLMATPLMEAVTNTNVDIVRMLLQYGASTDDCQDWLPLQIAVGAGHEEIVYLLLDYGANVNIKMSAIPTDLTLLEFCEKHSLNSVKSVILAHLIKRMALRDTVSSENEAFLNSALSELKSDWQKELLKMQRTKFRKELTVYDLMLADVSTTAGYIAKNKLKVNKLYKHVHVITSKFKYLDPTANYRIDQVMMALNEMMH